MDCLTEIDAVILAGGLGTRLQPVLPSTPKVIAPVGGKPFLKYVVDLLSSFGVRNMVLALGHKANDVKAYISKENWNGLNLIPHVEQSPMDTGGALREVLPLVKSDTVIVLNGDAFAKANLGKFLNFHRTRKASISILLTLVKDVSRYGVVKTDVDGKVLTFEEKLQKGKDTSGYVNAGVYLFEKTVITSIPIGRPVSLEREVFPKQCGNGLYGLNGTFPFIDIGTPESYSASSKFFGLDSDDN